MSEENSRGLGFVLIALSGLALIGLFVLQSILSPNPVDQYGCDELEEAPALAAFLFDVSDPLSDRQAADIRRRYLEKISALPTGSRIEVYQLVDDPDQLLEPIWLSCKPADKSTTGGLTDNPTLIRKRYQESFLEPAKNASESALTAQPADKSPIFEAIQSVAVSTLSADRDYRASKQLIIISDFLQNTDGFSNYRSGNNFEALSDSPYYRSIRSDLRGVDVEGWYLWRPDSGGLQNQAHAQFWARFFKEQKALSRTMKSVQGEHDAAETALQ